MELMSISFETLLKSGVHFGHNSKYWNPKMAPFIHSVRSKIHLINLEETLKGLKKAQEQLVKVSERGGKILFVSTKRPADKEVKNAALESGQHYINKRWLGGTLTNWKTVRQSIRHLKDLEKAAESGAFERLNKKESLEKTRALSKLEASLGGIKNMGGVPDLLFIIDIQKEHIALKEAQKMGLPTIAIVDTNVSPDGVTYPIPGNDDSTKAIKLYLEIAVQAIKAGASKRQLHNASKKNDTVSEETVEKEFSTVIEETESSSL